MAFGWRPYVPVTKRRQDAARAMRKLEAKGELVQPVVIEGRTIARTFWGKAWCENLERYSDFENRLPRGRTYVRNGSVCHLEIAQGVVKARVSGSTMYTVKISIKQLDPNTWEDIKQRCSGKISSLIDLLGGKLDAGVMEVVTDPKTGLFPSPKEISMDCSCPDWATMCKHVAAVLYGVGARLDKQPELLFLLRGVDHRDMVSVGIEQAVATVTRGGSRRRIGAEDLSTVFGIEMETKDAGETGTPVQPVEPDAPGAAGAARGKSTPAAAEKKTVPTRKAFSAKTDVARTDAGKSAAAAKPGVGKASVTKTAVAWTEVARTDAGKSAAAARTAAVKTAAEKKAASTGKASAAKALVKTPKSPSVETTARTQTGPLTTTTEARGRGTATSGTLAGSTARKTLQVAEGPFPKAITGTQVCALRSLLGLNGRDFAALLGVSGGAVSVWERNPAVLTLQDRSREALKKVWDAAVKGEAGSSTGMPD